MSQPLPKAEPERRVDVGDVTLVWGDRSQWKARLRSEAQQRFQDRPLSERVQAALSMVLPRHAPP